MSRHIYYTVILSQLKLSLAYPKGQKDISKDYLAAFLISPLLLHLTLTYLNLFKGIYHCL